MIEPIDINLPIKFRNSNFTPSVVIVNKKSNIKNILISYYDCDGEIQTEWRTSFGRRYNDSEHCMDILNKKNYIKEIVFLEIMRDNASFAKPEFKNDFYEITEKISNILSEV